MPAVGYRGYNVWNGTSADAPGKTKHIGTYYTKPNGRTYGIAANVSAISVPYVWNNTANFRFLHWY